MVVAFVVAREEIYEEKAGVRGERLKSVSDINLRHTHSWIYVYEAQVRDLVKMHIWWNSINGTGMAKVFILCFYSEIL